MAGATVWAEGAIAFELRSTGVSLVAGDGRVNYIFSYP